MAQTKSKPISDVEPKRRILASAKQIKKSTGRDPAKLPPRFGRILREALAPLHVPIATPRYPFEPLRPPARESGYVQIGVGLGNYVFENVDYAIIRFLFDTTEPHKVSKSRLKAWLVSKCNVPHSELEKCSWPDIREFSLSGIEAEYAAERKRKAKRAQESPEETRGRFTFNDAQAFFDGQDLGLPSNEPVLTLKRLVDSFGEVVKHKALELDSGPSSASDMLKGRIRIIKQAFKHHEVPCKIEAKRGIGYVLKQAATVSL